MAEIKGLFLKDKRASENLMYPVILPLVLNIMFIILVLFIVHKASTGAGVYEEFYAKQIALMLDNAKPNARLTLDFKEGIKIAEENKMLSKENLVKFTDNKVYVKLSGKEGYSMAYFSDYNVSSFFIDDNLIILIQDKKEVENEK